MTEKDVVFTGESAVENARILAQSLADIIGWTVENSSNGAYVKQSGIPIYFVIELYSGNDIAIRLSNGAVTIGGNTYYVTVTNTRRCTIWVLKSNAGTIAFGAATGNSGILNLPRNLMVVIAQNENGQYTGFIPKNPNPGNTGTETNMYNLWLYINEDSTKSKEYNTGYAAKNYGNPNKSIITRMVDFEYKTLFKDLYEVVTIQNITGVQKNSITLYANGTYYRIVANNGFKNGGEIGNKYYGALAVPDIT